MIRILNLEDDPVDSEIIQRRLDAEGLACEIVRVEREEEFTRAISDCRFDLIISDMRLPSFDGLRALELAKERCCEIPFIFFSGVLGEEAAVDTLKKGATDYCVKQRPARLASAVRRALDEASNIASAGWPSNHGRTSSGSGRPSKTPWKKGWPQPTSRAARCT